MQNIAVVGSGVVGRATGLGFISKGYDVTFCDINDAVLQKLANEDHKTVHLNDFQTDGFDVIFVSVSTPTEGGRINLSHIKSAASAIGTALARSDVSTYPVITVRSTVPPGTVENTLVPILERCSGKTMGIDFGVAVNPEYLREKHAEVDFCSPWMIVIGTNENRSWDILKELYTPFGCSIHGLSIKETEFQKYVHNLFNANKTSFFNEMRLVANFLGVETSRVFELVTKSAEGMWHPAYGTRDMGPFGGSCLPKDTQAFLSFAKEQGIDMPLLKATIFVNQEIERR